MRWNLLAAVAAVLWIVGIVVWQLSLWIAVALLVGAAAATAGVVMLRWQQRDHGVPTTSLAQKWVLAARAWAGSPVRPSPLDRHEMGTADRLTELERLHRAGQVTDAEYKMKRGEILEGL